MSWIAGAVTIKQIETGRRNPKLVIDKSFKTLRGFWICICRRPEFWSYGLQIFCLFESNPVVTLLWMDSFYNMVSTLRSSRLATVSRGTPSFVCHIFGFIFCLNFASVGKLFITFDRPLAIYQRMSVISRVVQIQCNQQTIKLPSLFPCWIIFCLLVSLISNVHFVMVKT